MPSWRPIAVMPCGGPRIGRRRPPRHDTTVDTLTDELERARQLAHRNGQAAAAVSATLGKARLHGLLANKIQVGAHESLAAVMKAIDGKTRVFNPASN